MGFWARIAPNLLTPSMLGVFAQLSSTEEENEKADPKPSTLGVSAQGE